MYWPNIYKPSTDSVLVKACTIILHRHSISYTVVKTCITIHYRHLTGFVVVKMGLLKFYSPLIGFWSCQNRHTKASQTFNSSQNWLGELVQTFTRLCGNWNGLTKALEVFNNLCHKQNKVDNHLQSLNYLSNSPNGLREYLQAFNGVLGIIKWASTLPHKLCSSRCWTPTGLQLVFKLSKCTYQTSTNLQQTLW